MVRTFLAGRHIPDDVAAVRDDQGRIWHRGDDQRFHTRDGRHHQAPAELAARTDLTETPGEVTELGLAA